mmetsp:Transcript_11472/g.29606  ORF Transcript_11472/g.29606 Transcript_11472/m.29606 type:complete len:306 (+) Transcript_11472:237-1154(+)
MQQINKSSKFNFAAFRGFSYSIDYSSQGGVVVVGLLLEEVVVRVECGSDESHLLLRCGVHWEDDVELVGLVEHVRAALLELGHLALVVAAPLVLHVHPVRAARPHGAVAPSLAKEMVILNVKAEAGATGAPERWRLVHVLAPSAGREGLESRLGLAATRIPSKTLGLLVRREHLVGVAGEVDVRDVGPAGTTELAVADVPGALPRVKNLSAADFRSVWIQWVDLVPVRDLPSEGLGELLDLLDVNALSLSDERGGVRRHHLLRRRDQHGWLCLDLRGGACLGHEVQNLHGGGLRFGPLKQLSTQP